MNHNDGDSNVGFRLINHSRVTGPFYLNPLGLRVPWGYTHTTQITLSRSEEILGMCRLDLGYFGFKHSITKYLREHCWLDSCQSFSLKHLFKNALIKPLSPQ